MQQAYIGCVHNITRPVVDPIWEDYNAASVGIKEVQCLRRAFTRKAHGFLCPDHYTDQQLAAPAAPRKPYRTYYKVALQRLSENKFLDHIIESEREIIAALRAKGGTEVRKLGRYEPVCIEFVRN